MKKQTTSRYHVIGKNLNSAWNEIYKASKLIKTCKQDEAIKKALLEHIEYLKEKYNVRVSLSSLNMSKFFEGMNDKRRYHVEYKRDKDGKRLLKDNKYIELPLRKTDDNKRVYFKPNDVRQALTRMAKRQANA